MARSMLSLLAGLGQGYNQGTQQQFENDRKTKLDQIALDRAAREGTEFDQSQADRTELRAAGAPVAATPDTVQTADGTQQRMLPDPSSDNRDAGEAGTATPIPAQRVGMQGLMAPDQANAAVAAANTPEAMRARQLAVLQKQSPEKAAILQAHDLSLKNTQMDVANKEFDSAASAAAAKGWDAFGKFMDDSQADNSKGKWVPSADGKTMQAYKMGPDGTLQPSGLIFENSPKGLAEAATFVSKQVPITAKLKHYMDVKEADRKEGHDQATERYQDRMAGVAEQNAATNEKFREDMGAAATTKAGKGVVERMTEVDKLTFTDLNKQRETINNEITKARAQGMWNDKDPGAQQLLTQQNALGMRAQALIKKYDTDGSSGAPDPLGVRKPPAAAKPASTLGATGPTNAAERGMQAAVKLTPAEEARDAANNATPGNLAELDAEIARTTNPDTKQILLAERTKLTSTPPTRMAAVAPPPAAPPVAAPAAVAPPAVAPKPAVAVPPLEAAGQKLDAARAALATATQTLQTFGLRQRSQNPEGYRAAVAAAQAAKTARDEAEVTYSSLATQGPANAQAAIRYPKA
jgi:hypothetical protein